MDHNKKILRPTVSGVNVIKLFTTVSYDFSKYARAFVPGKPLQPSLMFVGEAMNLP